MRSLSSTLLAAQKRETRVPAPEVKARNLRGGVVNPVWTRLYTGSEMAGPHALTFPGDGSLVRVRATPASDNRKLYRQRVTNPGPEADFSQWTYLNAYDAMAAAVCSLEAEVSLFRVKSDGEIDRRKSTDYGATFSNLDYPGYAPSGNVTQMAAAYKPNGDLGLFLTDSNMVCFYRRTSGGWQACVNWDKTTCTCTA